MRQRQEPHLDPEESRSSELFKKHYEDRSLVPRLTLIAAAILLIGATPFYDSAVLGVPEAFRQFSRWMQFGVQIPPILLALFCTWYRPMRPWSAPVLMFAAMATAGGLCAQHVVAPRHGFHVPHDFAALALAATCLLGRLRLSFFLPWAGLAMIAISAAELYFFKMSSAAIYDVISMWMLLGLAVVAAQTFENFAFDNWRQQAQLESQATRDWLTGLPNRRHFDSTLATLMRMAAREKRSLALVLLDVDHFKLFNDRYGHPAGDEALRLIGRWLDESLRRPNDFCARVGGEEFAAVWYDANPEAAPAMAEQLRMGISKLGIEHRSPTGRNVVTCSAGFVQVAPPESETQAVAAVKSLYDHADQALYQAKRSGRDCLVQYGDLVLGRPRAAPTVEVKPAAEEAEPDADDSSSTERS